MSLFKKIKEKVPKDKTHENIAEKILRECEVGASIDIKLEKDNMFGDMKVGQQRYSVYLGNVHAEYVCGQIKRVFTLIER